MNQDFFRKWKTGVLELNSSAQEVSEGRDVAYEVLAKEIKKIFSRNGTPVEKIHFNSDSSVVTVELSGDHSNDIRFKKTFLIDIGMNFSVKRKITDYGDTMLYVELYPLDEEV